MSKFPKAQHQKNQGPSVLQNPYIQIPPSISTNQRYLYIRITDLYDMDKSLISLEGRTELNCYLGNKCTRTVIEVQNGKLVESNQDRLKKQTHLFCYEAEQILTIQLAQPKQCQNIDALGSRVKRQKLTESGLSRILLTPFIIFPYTRHKIKSQLVAMTLQNKIQTKKAGMLQFELYYFLKFQGKIEISPINAKFGLNRANLGMMRACCIITVNGQRKKSVIDEEGGIYPNWEKQCLKLQKMYSGKSYDDNPQKLSKQTINNRLVFGLNSVGHSLKIQIVNFPILDKDAQLVGETEISLQSHDFFRIPNKDISHNELKVYYTHPHTKQKMQAGTINLKTKFLYNAKAIRKQVDSEDDYQ